MMRTILGALVAFAFTFACFVALGPQEFYKADGPRLVLHVMRENPAWPQHPFYLPIVIAFRRLVEALGLPIATFDVCRFASAIGTAIGVASAFVGMRFFFSRMRNGATLAAILATLLVATSPVVLLFGSVVEIHGVFFAPVGIAFGALCFAMSARSRAVSLVAASVAGGITAVATGIHASGLLLPAAFAPLMIAKQLDDDRVRSAPHGWTQACAATLPTILAFGLVHTALVFVLTDPLSARTFVHEGFGRPQGIEHLPRVVFDEFLMALLPLSVLACLASLRARTRALGVAALVSAVPYCAAALHLLVNEPEFGAYLIPLVLPYAAIAVLAWPRYVLVAAVVVGASLGIRTLRFFEPKPADAQYRRDLGERFESGGGAVFLGTPSELTAFLLAAPQFEPMPLDEFLVQPPETVRAALPYFDSKLDERLSHHELVLLTEGARQLLTQPADTVLRSGNVLGEHLRERYAFDDVSHGTFRAAALRRL